MNLPQQKLLWLLIVGCYGLPALAKYDGFYEIELIAFTQYQTDTESEQWPQVPDKSPGPPPRVQRAIPAGTSSAIFAPHDLTDITNPPPARGEADLMPPSDHTGIPETVEFTELTAEQLQLGSLVTKLRRRRLAARTLLHTGWVQKIKPASASVPVLVEGGEPLFVSPQAPLFNRSSTSVNMASITRLMDDPMPDDSLLDKTARHSTQYEL